MLFFNKKNIESLFFIPAFEQIIIQKPKYFRLVLFIVCTYGTYTYVIH